ncbi:MAG: DUF362 domain-containing protein [Verrucomicrobia bacterium]|nr:DUF362 domain-containing protein [Verrucomicrobiota bacterium]
MSHRDGRQLGGQARGLPCAAASLGLVWAAWLAGASHAGVAPTGSVAPLPSARAVVVDEPGAVVTFSPKLEPVRRAIERGMTHLTATADATAAWRSLMSTQDVVGIKVYSGPGATSGTRPAVAEALVQSLLAAGWPAERLILWDRELAHLRRARFVELADKYRVRVAGAREAGYDTNHYYASPFIGQLVAGDHEFGREGPGIGRHSYVSKLVTEEMTKIINLVPLLNHNLAGVSGNLFSLAFGSVDNTLRFAGNPGAFAVAVPEIYALPVLGDRVVLNIVDALIAQYYGEERSLLHYSVVLDELRLSTDAVALDVLSIQELERQRQLADVPQTRTDLTLYQNATLVEIGVSDLRRIVIEQAP